MVGIRCTHCDVLFDSNDSIYSTRCGHVYHYLCLMKWKVRGDTCPFCKEYKQQTFRLDLNFVTGEAEDIIEDNETDESIENVDTLLEQLKLNVEVITKMEEVAKIGEEHYIRLTDNYIAKQRNLYLLNNHIEKLILKISDLENQINDMIIIVKDIPKMKDDECDSLKGRVFLSRIVVLQEKLSTAWSTLQDNRINSKELTNELEGLVGGKELNYNIDGSYNFKNSNGEYYVPRYDDYLNQKILMPLNELNNQLPTAIIIRNLSEHLIQNSIKETLIHLANKMDIPLNQSDIIGAFYLHMKKYYHSSNSNEKRTMMIYFKSHEMKDMFMERIDILTNIPSSNELILKECPDEYYDSSISLPDLLQYAGKLKDNGFSTVFCKNKMVLAKYYKESPLLRIYSTQQVDELIRKYNKN